MEREALRQREGSGESAAEILSGNEGPQETMK